MDPTDPSTASLVLPFLLSSFVGLSANKFIVSYASAGSTTEVGNMVFMMGTYENKAITLKNPHLYENHGNYGYYDMDKYVLLLFLHD